MCYVTGVEVRVHMNCDSPVGNAEERLAESINASATAVNKCAPIVERLRQQYHQTPVKSEKDYYRHLIYRRYLDLLEVTKLYDVIRKQAEMLTNMALGDINLTGAEVASSIILYCEVSTVEALSYLQQMIDSGELSELLSSMLSLLADTDVIATVSLSPQQYLSAITILDSADGKDH